MRELNRSFLPLARAVSFDFGAPAADGDVVFSGDSSISDGLLVRGVQFTVNRTETNAGGTPGADGYKVQFQYAPGGEWVETAGYFSPGIATNYETTLFVANINSINNALSEDVPIWCPAGFNGSPDGTTGPTEVSDLASSWVSGVVVYGVRMVWSQSAGDFTAGIHKITASLVLL